MARPVGFHWPSTRRISTVSGTRDFRRNPVDSGTARIEHDFGQNFTLRSQLRYTVSENHYVGTSPELAEDFNTGELEPGLIYRLPIANNDRSRDLVSQTDLSGHFDTGPIHHDIDAGFEYSYEGERLLGPGPWAGYNVVSSAGPQGFSGGDCGDPALTLSYDCTNVAAPQPVRPMAGARSRPIPRKARISRRATTPPMHSIRLP